MSISSVAPGPGAFDPLRDIRSLAARNPAPPPTPGQAAAQAQALSKAEIANDAAQARQNPMFQAQDSRKTQAREKLQRLRDWDEDRGQALRPEPHRHGPGAGPGGQGPE